MDGEHWNHAASGHRPPPVKAGYRPESHIGKHYEPQETP